jgi:hypothetical protein
MQEVDVVLDSYPFGGYTTSLECFGMGVCSDRIADFGLFWGCPSVFASFANTRDTSVATHCGLSRQAATAK